MLNFVLYRKGGILKCSIPSETRKINAVKNKSSR